MPLYEYHCDNCGELFEKLQKFADEPLTAHEKCGGGPVQRLVSAPAFHFKGSGWYVNDYAKGGAPQQNGEAKKSETAASTDGKENSGSKNDSGSATKSSDSSSSSSSSSAPAPSSSPSPAPAGAGSSSDKK
jgi:putative FmdB family regulatory protein